MPEVRPPQPVNITEHLGDTLALTLTYQTDAGAAESHSGSSWSGPGSSVPPPTCTCRGATSPPAVSSTDVKAGTPGGHLGGHADATRE